MQNTVTCDPHRTTSSPVTTAGQRGAPFNGCVARHDTPCHVLLLQGQSAAEQLFSHEKTQKKTTQSRDWVDMEPATRVELVTCCLQNSCSATELRRRRNNYSMPYNRRQPCYY